MSLSGARLRAARRLPPAWAGEELFLAAARRGGRLRGCGADVAAPAQRRPVMGRRREE